MADDNKRPIANVPKLPDLSKYKLTSQQEKFVMAYCDPGKPSFHNTLRSIAEAGYAESSRPQVTMELNRKPKVWAAVEEFDKYLIARICADREALSLMLLEDRVLAREMGQASAAVGADKVLANMHGMLADNLNINATGTTKVVVELVPSKAPFGDDD